MGIVQNLQTLLNEKKSWSAKVETEWHPKEGFFSQSAEKIASGLKKASTDLKQAMSRLNFYKNRAGKNLSAEDKARLSLAKEKLHALYESNMNEAKGDYYEIRVYDSVKDYKNYNFEIYADNIDGKKTFDKLTKEARAKYPVVETIRRPDGDTDVFAATPDIQKKLDSTKNESDNTKSANWLVRCYDKNEKVTCSFAIKDRTEHEAEREAESDPRVLDADDWTMTKKSAKSECVNESKTITAKSGIKGWQDKLNKVYSSFEEFERYCENYGIHKRLGYKTPEAAWKDNPTIQGSVQPSDLRKVKSECAMKPGTQKQPGRKPVEEAAKKEPAYATDKESGKKFRIYDIGVSWATIIPEDEEDEEDEDVSDKIKLPIGDLWEFYDLYDINRKKIKADINEGITGKTYTAMSKAELSKLTPEQLNAAIKMMEKYIDTFADADVGSKTEGGRRTINMDAVDKLLTVKENLAYVKKLAGASETIQRRGSQNREKLSDLKDEYTLITKRPIGAKNPTEVVLYNIPAKKQEVWGLSDDFAGYVIEINGKGYEFIRSLTKKED